MPPDPEAQRRFDKLNEQFRENAKVRAYFEALHYKVGWDGRYGANWHEISDDNGLIAQIDHYVPLADIVMDLTYWATSDDTKGVSKTDYTVSGDFKSKRFKDLCRRVAQNQFGGLQQDLPL